MSSEIPSLPPLESAQPVPTHPGSPWRKPSTVIAAVALVLLGWQWVETRSRLSDLQEELSRRLSEGDTVGKEARAIARQGQENLQDLQGKLGAMESRLAESQGQQVALESMYQEFSRSRDDRVLAEVEQAVTIAAQQLQLAGNVQAALFALQTADARLGSVDRPQWLPLRKAITSDIETLKALPQVDAAGVALRLETLIGRLDGLPLAFEARPKAEPVRADKGEPSLAGRLWAEFWVEFSQLVRIERIVIAGNTKTRDRVIRREFQILEGDLYSQTLIERSRTFINALGYFERVDFSEEEGSSPNLMVINVEVAERATGTFQVGAGFSSIERFIITAQIQQQNLFGRGQSLSLQVQLSGIRQQFQLNFVEPWFLDSRWTLGVNAFYTVQQRLSFNQASTGGGVTLGHPVLDPRLRFFVNYGLEHVTISARTGGFFGNTNATGFNQFQDLGLFGQFRAGFTSSVRLSLTWDSRDNRQFASTAIPAITAAGGADATSLARACRTGAAAVSLGS